MARILARLAVVAALTTFAHAGIQFKSPAAGSTQKAGTAIEVEWSDAGSDGPALADLSTFTLDLMAGGNTDGSFIPVLGITSAGQFAAGTKASGMVGPAVGDNTPKNAYFLRMIATSKTGGTYTAYSPRFSYSGMTAGTFPGGAPIAAGLKTITGTDGPDNVDSTTQKPEDAAPDAKEFDVPYIEQTGTIRYAPMQPVPPTKITKQKATPQYSTSSVEIARAILPTPKVQTTITQSQTHSVQSMENTVAAAPMPSDDMAKFLNRWKD